MSPNLFIETQKNLISKGKLVKNSLFQANLIFVAMFGVITVAFGIESFTARQNFVISFESFFFHLTISVEGSHVLTRKP